MKITAYPEDTSPANNDLLLTVDVSSGTNKKVTVTNLINTIADIANLPVNGWFGSNSSVSSVTYNGNRSYSVVTGTNLSSTISAGMRLRTTRTVSAPTQCTSLNGTNQYFNKTSPAGMTFTDDFVVSAWVKLTRYPGAGTVGIIASRYNGTSGWATYIDSSGRILTAGWNAGAINYSQVQSYQSVPLDKWVHVAVQLDMSAFTATTTTSYIMIDGVDVTALVLRGGTNPTALVQAGNLEIGSYNGGSNPFPGKLAQVAIFNAKVTQATIRGYISQGLAGNETSLISAYSFNNSINDLNTTNANNLTAQNSAVATNADSPFGGQSDGTISSTLDYGIVQKVSGTTLTVQVAEGNTIPTSGGVSSISYSNFKAPYGFPAQRGKWAVEYIVKIDDSGAVNANQIYAITSVNFTLPIGEWALAFKAVVQNIRASGGFGAATAGLSTSSSSFSNDKFVLTHYHSSNVSNISVVTPFVIPPTSVSTTSATSYYFLKQSGTADTMGVRGDIASTVIQAENAYL